MTRALPRLRAAVAVGVLAACAPAAVYDVEVRFGAGGPRAGAVSVEVYVVAGGCGGLAAGGATPAQAVAGEVVRPGEASRVLGQVPTGRIGLYARARDAACRVIAAGCAEYDVRARGGPTLGVTLVAVDGPAGCDPGAVCAAGTCGPPTGADGGLPDAGLDAGGPPPSDVGDVGDLGDVGDASRVCARGTADCDGNPANGCEANLRTSGANCGACGRVCQTNVGTASNPCVDGACVPNCNDGYDLCNDNVAGGCTTDLSTPENCGSCGRRCGPVRPVCRNDECLMR